MKISFVKVLKSLLFVGGSTAFARSMQAVFEPKPAVRNSVLFMGLASVLFAVRQYLNIFDKTGENRGVS